MIKLYVASYLDDYSPGDRDSCNIEVVVLEWEKSILDEPLRYSLKLTTGYLSKHERRYPLKKAFNQPYKQSSLFFGWRGKSTRTNLGRIILKDYFDDFTVSHYNLANRFSSDLFDLISGKVSDKQLVISSEKLDKWFSKVSSEKPHPDAELTNFQIRDLHRTANLNRSQLTPQDIEELATQYNVSVKSIKDAVEDPKAMEIPIESIGNAYFDEIVSNLENILKRSKSIFHKNDNEEDGKEVEADDEVVEVDDEEEENKWIPKAEYKKKYQAYLDSDEWKEKRQRVLLRDDHLCQGCLLKKATEVHHKTYDNVFNELMFELISLCRQCHSRIHGK